MKKTTRIEAIIEKTRNRFFVILRQGRVTIQRIQAENRADAEQQRQILLKYARKSGLDVNRY